MRCQSWSEAGKTSSYGLMWTESTALQQASLQDVDSGAVEFLGLGVDLFRRSAGRSTAAVQGTPTVYFMCFRSAEQPEEN